MFGGDGESRDRKRPRRDEGVCYTLLIPSRSIKDLIGSGGGPIRDIEQATSAVISVAKKGEFVTADEKYVDVKGAPAAKMAAVSKLIQHILEHDAQSQHKLGYAFSLLIPRACVRLVIGSKGSKISEIGKTTGCWIGIPKEGDADIYGRTNLAGSIEQICAAAEAIFQIVEMVPVEGGEARFNGRPQGFSLQNFPQEAFPQPSFTPQPSFAPPPMHLAPAPVHVATQPVRFEPLPMGFGREAQPRPHVVRREPNPKFEKPALPSNGVVVFGQPSTRTYLTGKDTGNWVLLLPVPIVGGIIGKKGQTISEIEQNSGSKIDVHPKAGCYDGHKTVALKGSVESKRIALEYVLNIVASHSYNDEDGNSLPMAFVFESSSREKLNEAEASASSGTDVVFSDLELPELSQFFCAYIAGDLHQVVNACNILYEMSA